MVHTQFRVTSNKYTHYRRIMNGFPPPPPLPSSSSSSFSSSFFFSSFSEHQELTNSRVSNWVQIGYRLGFCGVVFAWCQNPEQRVGEITLIAIVPTYLLTYIIRKPSTVSPPREGEGGMGQGHPPEWAWPQIIDCSWGGGRGCSSLLLLKKKLQVTTTTTSLRSALLLTLLL